jgi:RNA polymerase sigma factor (sigma-70 family)
MAKSAKAVEVSTPANWSVAQFSSFYAENRAELIAHANRILKDRARAEEVSQEALIKFMLATPELSSEDHALSYLHRTIENLCIDLFRAENRRPNLVALDDASAEVESTWQVSGDHTAEIAAAEDAAIVRQALSLLSPAERAALVMWEMEGRSTQEIAKELGIKESAVRHTVSRARASLRKVLSTLVIDEKRGLTALDLLSTTYKKASNLASKSGKVAMSLVLLVTAFLGFNSMTGSEPIQTVISAPVVEEPIATEPAVTNEVTEGVVTQVAPKSPAPSLSTEDATAELEFLNAQLGSAAVMLETLQIIEGKE